MAVYVVRIGKFVKIGFSTNVAARLNAFRISNPEIVLLLTIPGGDRALEKRLHFLLSESRIAREIFRDEWRVASFIERVSQTGLQNGLDFLESTTPQKRAEVKRSDRETRVRRKRMNKAQLDAYFAGLVADRKHRLGW